MRYSLALAVVVGLIAAAPAQDSHKRVAEALL